MGQQELYSNKFFENDEDPFGEQAARRKKAADRVRRCLTALLAIAIIGGGTLWFMQNKGELLLGKGAARQMGPSDTAAAAPQ